VLFSIVEKVLTITGSGRRSRPESAKRAIVSFAAS
jgi:hypothetical protein